MKKNCETYSIPFKNIQSQTNFMERSVFKAALQNWISSFCRQSSEATVADPLTPTSTSPSLAPVGHWVILLHPASREEAGERQ